MKTILLSDRFNDTINVHDIGSISEDDNIVIADCRGIHILSRDESREKKYMWTRLSGGDRWIDSDGKTIAEAIKNLKEATYKSSTVQPQFILFNNKKEYLSWLENIKIPI